MHNITVAPQDVAMEHDGWHGIATAPEGCDLALSVIDRDGVHELIFACRLVDGKWVNAMTGRRVDVQPTHWREWPAIDGSAVD